MSVKSFCIILGTSPPVSNTSILYICCTGGARGGVCWRDARSVKGDLTWNVQYWMYWIYNNNIGIYVATTKAFCFSRGSVQNQSHLREYGTEWWIEKQTSGTLSGQPVPWCSGRDTFPNAQSEHPNCDLWPLSLPSPDRLVGRSGNWVYVPYAYTFFVLFIILDIKQRPEDSVRSNCQSNQGCLLKLQSSTDEKASEERQWLFVNTTHLGSECLTHSCLVSSE